eukprot:2364839-Rhodomonas_salina.1
MVWSVETGKDNNDAIGSAHNYQQEVQEFWLELKQWKCQWLERRRKQVWDSMQCRAGTGRTTMLNWANLSECAQKIKGLNFCSSQFVTEDKSGIPTFQLLHFRSRLGNAPVVQQWIGCVVTEVSGFRQWFALLAAGPGTSSDAGPLCLLAGQVLRCQALLRRHQVCHPRGLLNSFSGWEMWVLGIWNVDASR